MRSLKDEQGSAWDVTVGRESWGTFVLLFSRATGGDVRRSVMASENMLEAQQELDSLAADELRKRLAAAEPWA
ncbi:hypothetical protein BH23GEM3_BH23GEM3_24800 [soil metagenome]|nr:hypothetical protein [Gemmatimonadota bacterium]